MPERVERQPVDLSQGGVIAVILGEGGDLPTEYGFHQRVRPIDGRIINTRDPQQQLPANMRAAIFGGGKKLDRKIFESVHEYLKRKRIVYRICNNDSHLLQVLKEMVPAEQKPDVAKVNGSGGLDAAAAPVPVVADRQIAERGAIKRFVAEHLPAMLKKDATMPVAEAARQLFRVAQDAQMTTTLLSLGQAIRVYKRDRSIGERPPSVQTPEQRGLTGIDEIIGHMENTLAAMKRMRDQFVTREQEHAKLTAQTAKMREVFSAFKDEIEGT